MWITRIDSQSYQLSPWKVALLHGAFLLELSQLQQLLCRSHTATKSPPSPLQLTREGLSRMLEWKGQWASCLSCASCKSPVSSKMPARSLKVVTASASYNNYKLRDKEMSHCWGWVLGGKQFMTPFLVYVFYLIQGLCGCHKQVLGLLLLLFYFLFFILIVKRDVGARWAMTVMA